MDGTVIIMLLYHAYGLAASANVFHLRIAEYHFCDGSVNPIEFENIFLWI